MLHTVYIIFSSATPTFMSSVNIYPLRRCTYMKVVVLCDCVVTWAVASLMSQLQIASAGCQWHLFCCCCCLEFACLLDSSVWQKLFTLSLQWVKLLNVHGCHFCCKYSEKIGNSRINILVFSVLATYVSVDYQNDHFHSCVHTVETNTLAVGQLGQLIPVVKNPSWATFHWILIVGFITVWRFVTSHTLSVFNFELINWSNSVYRI